MYYQKKTWTKTNWPVEIEEAKAHLRVPTSFTLDDGYIKDKIQEATRICETYVGFDIATTSNVMKISDFIGTTISFTEGNFLSLTSIQLSDASTSVSVDETIIGPNSVLITLSESIETDPLYVNWISGYEDGIADPQIKAAVQIKIGDLYDLDRQSATEGSVKPNNRWKEYLDGFKITKWN